MGEKLGSVLKAAREAKGLNQDHIASHLGVSRQAVGGWESGRSNPTSQNLQDICRFLGIDLAAASSGRLVPAQNVRDNLPPKDIMPTSLGASVGNAASEMQLIAIEPQSRSSMPMDVPVLGVAVGGSDGHFLLNGEVIDYIRRPSGIMKTRDVFAIYVVGSSMSPRFEEGEPVYLTKGRVPSIGDYVVVVLRESVDGLSKAIIKRLIRRTPSFVTLEQFNPPQELRIDSDEVKEMYRVIPWAEVLGI